MTQQELAELLDEIVSDAKEIASANEWGTSDESYRRSLKQNRDRILAAFAALQPEAEE